MDKIITVKMLTRGPNGGYRIGQTVQVDPARAANWITNGHAEIHTEGLETAIAELSTTETATKDRSKKNVRDKHASGRRAKDS